MAEFAARQRCDCKGYKLILMDLDMPEMNGYEATICIRKINKKVPIIAVTAFTGKRDVEACFAAGMNDHRKFSRMRGHVVAKPFRVSGLLRLLIKWLESFI